MKKPELLAPAGSYASLVAAMNGTADAVYIGGAKFGARAFAHNFEEEDLIAAIDYVHLRGRQVYLTINTLLKNHELENELYNYLAPYYEHGLDAVIVQDIGVLDFVHREFPEIDIHASTQMSVTGVSGAGYLKDKGVTRVVTARELSLPEIKKIKIETGLEIEAFVHGALCYCYSGQCLMSSMIGGRSGNRGRCAQPCRLPYEFLQNGHTLSKKDEPYLLSPKDMNGLSLIPDLIEAGIDSFKIEGRMKKPEYVALVTAIYRKYIDQYMADPKRPYSVDPEDDRVLMELYNRGGFTDGYYKTQNGPSMMAMGRPNHNGVYVGSIERINGNTISFTCQEVISKQDVLEVRLNKSQTVDLTSPIDCDKGKLITLNANNIRSLRTGMNIYRMKNKKLIQSIETDIIHSEQKEEIQGRITLTIGEPSKIEISSKYQTSIWHGEIVSPAQKQPVTADRVISQISKTGSTRYQFSKISVEVDDQAFISVQGLKELRRNGIAQLEADRLKCYRRTRKKSIAPLEIRDKAAKSQEIVVSIEQLSYLPQVLKCADVAAVYIDMAIIAFAKMEQLTKQVHKTGKKIYFMLPYILRSNVKDTFIHNKEWLLQGEWDGFVVRNLEELSFFADEGHYKGELILDYNVYHYNQRSINSHQMDLSYTMPLELNYQELKELKFPASEIIIYGRMPVMFTAQCLVKNTQGCNNKSDTYQLKDRLKKTFLVKNICKYCYNVIYNERPISLFQQYHEVSSLAPDRLRIHLVDESEQDVETILDQIINIVQGKKVSGINADSTKGHFKRGID